MPSKHRGVAGCVHQYCYCREEKYYPYEDPQDFAYRIQVKENAPELLRRALSRAPVDVVMTGDYQPADHGGQFVMASGLTLADQQREYFFGVLRERLPDLLERYRDLYPEGSYGPAKSNWRETALRLRELCERYGISDRMPRPIIPGDKRALNKRVVEALANQVYAMELDSAPGQRIWAYRKAAWAIEDTPQDLGLIYRTMGRKGLESIENVGPKMAQVVEDLLSRGPILRQAQEPVSSEWWPP